MVGRGPAHASVQAVLATGSAEHADLLVELQRDSGAWQILVCSRPSQGAERRARIFYVEEHAGSGGGGTWGRADGHYNKNTPETRRDRSNMNRSRHGLYGFFFPHSTADNGVSSFLQPRPRGGYVVDVNVWESDIVDRDRKAHLPKLGKAMGLPEAGHWSWVPGKPHGGERPGMGWQLGPGGIGHWCMGPLGWSFQNAETRRERSKITTGY